MTQQRYEEFKSHMKKQIDASGKQCECLQKQYRPFILGGEVHHVIQCPNAATVKIISHAEHEKDIPPMFLCDTCLELFKKDNEDILSDYEIIEVS